MRGPLPPDAGIGWIVGWAGIGAYIGMAPRTARKYCDRTNLPVHRLPGNRPAIIPWEADLWLLEVTRLKKAKKTPKKATKRPPRVQPDDI